MLRPARVENVARSETLPSGRPLRPGRLQCEHCKKLGHTKDRCWELVGRPTTVGPSPSKSKGKAKQAPSQAFVSSTIGSGSLTEKEIQAFRRLMSGLSTPSTGAADTSEPAEAEDRKSDWVWEDA